MIQLQCPDLIKTKSDLFKGTHLTKIQANINKVKGYLQSITFAKNDLLVVKNIDPLCRVREYSCPIPFNILGRFLKAYFKRFLKRFLNHQLISV